MSYFIGTLLFTCVVLFHGDLDQRIQEKSNQIQASPLDYGLYLERGELYLLHEEYLKARIDFSFCIDHQLINTRVLLGISSSLLNLNRPDSALIFVEQILSIEENHLSALELKGTIQSRLEKYCEAAGTVEQLISIADHPSPALFLDASKYWSSCNEPYNNQKAIDILEKGMRRIGPVIVIQQHLATAYKRSGNYEDAIRVQTSIIEQSNLKIRPYYERARLYIEMKLPDKAAEDLNIALSLIDHLPPHKKSLSSIESIRSEMSILLTDLKK